MNLYTLVKRLSWFVIATACICIGLDAVGVDVESLLHLQSMDMTLRYFVGACGVGSLVDLVVMGSACRK